MAISTFTELKQAVIDWTHRDDLDLKIPDFIRLVELEMYNNPVERLKVLEEEVLTTSTLSANARFLALPPQFKLMRRARIALVNDSQPLVFTTPNQLSIRDNTGRPYFFTITSQLEFDIAADVDYSIELQHLSNVAPLTEVAPTNSILTAYPSIYLYGCLWAASKYGNDTEIANANYQSFISHIQGANLSTEDAKYGPAPSMSRRRCMP